jgi:hypothetical protein
MSTLNVSNISDGTDTVATGYVVNGSAKAWVNYGTSGSTASRETFNVTSLTDQSAGNTTITLTSAFTNSDYPYVAESTNYHATLNTSSKSAGSFRVATFSQAHALEDAGQVCALAHGDLA